MVRVDEPVVLVNGYFDRIHITNTWRVAERILKELGIETFTPQVDPHGSIDKRTDDLIKDIQGRFRKSGKTVYIHIWGHSMGGINARHVAYRAYKTDLGFKVRTVTTFGTPHRGVKAIDKIPFYENLRAFVRKCGDQAFFDLSEDRMKQFNKDTPDVTGVRYFSWAGKCTIPSDITQLFWNFTHLDGATDGMVNVDSAVWNLGPTAFHLGTFLGVDHINIPCYAEAIEKTLPHLDMAEYDRDDKFAPVLSIGDTFSAATRLLPRPLQTVVTYNVPSSVQTVVNLPREVCTNLRGTVRTVTNHVVPRPVLAAKKRIMGFLF